MVLFKEEDVSPHQKEKIKLFHAVLLKFNKTLPLFSRQKEDEVLKRLFEDSQKSGKLLNSFMSKETPILDVGSGNGFPGIVFSILYPEVRFYLCERNQKKAEFLEHAKFVLKLPNTSVLNKDVRDIKGSFKLIFSKATAPTKDVLELLKDKIHKEGLLFLWKTSDWEQEKLSYEGFSLEVFGAYERSWSNKKGVLVQVKTQSDI